MTTTVKLTAKNAETGEAITKKTSGWVNLGRGYMWARKEAAKLTKLGYGEISIEWF